jgi:hypothetical protein
MGIYLVGGSPSRPPFGAANILLTAAAPIVGPDVPQAFRVG